MIVLLGVGALPGTAAAQETGAIAGSVVDSTGGALPGVTVEASSPSLIEGTRVGVTDGEGLYRIINLRSGTYNVTFTLPGFSALVRDGLELSAGVTINVDGEMAVGAVEETVTVTGAAPLVDVQSVTQAEQVTREFLDEVPTGRHWANYVVLIPGVTTSRHDVGGSSEMSTPNPAMGIHGSVASEMPLIIDGMRYSNIFGVGGASSGPMIVNNGIVEEIAVTTSGGGADQEVSGVVANIIPKQGGNNFSVYAFANYNNDSMQADNLDAALRERGASSGSVIEKAFDFNIGVGGPIQSDRLWFYTSFRQYGIDDAPSGARFESNPGDNLFIPDTSRFAVNENRIKSGNLRLTYQAAQNNKFTFYIDETKRELSANGLNSRVSFEGATVFDDPVDRLWQASWTWTASNNLLIEVGETYKPDAWQFRLQDGTADGQPGIFDFGTGQRYRSSIFSIRQDSQQWNGKANMTYVTGSHALKVGGQWFHGGRLANDRGELVQDQWYQFINGSPFRIVQVAPGIGGRETLDVNLGLYVQETYTRDQLTLNAGLRFDHLNMGIPEQTLAGSTWVGPRTFDAIPDIVSWKDISPRVGLSYDVTGDGRTAIKWNLGRFVEAQAANFIQAINPARATVVRDGTRDWSDADGNFIPDCDLTNFAANGECGAILNPAFAGQVADVPIRFDPDGVNGWGTRGYNWETMAGIEHQLTDYMSMDVSYHRRWFGNFRVDNLTLATPADYTEYSVVSPLDPRLPGGGGDIVAGLWNINDTALRGDTTIAPQDAFGKQSRIFNGVDVGINVRFPDGASLSGGTSTGRLKEEACFVVDSPQAIDDWRGGRFCSITPPFQTQLKLAGVYPLPWGGVQASATYQTFAGPEVIAEWTIPTAVPVLGRVPVEPTIQLVEPGTLYGDRVHQVDFRVSKIFSTGGTGRIQALFDLYNLFNANPVLRQNNTFGSAWQRPITVLTGRLAKFAVQFDF